MIKDTISKIASQSFGSVSPFSIYTSEMLPESIKGIPGSLLNKLSSKIRGTDYNFGSQTESYKTPQTSEDDFYQNNYQDYSSYQGQQVYPRSSYYSDDTAQSGNFYYTSSNETDILNGIRFEIKKSNDLLKKTLNSIDYGFQNLQQKTQNIIASNNHLFDTFDRNNKRLINKLTNTSRLNPDISSSKLSYLEPLYEIANNTEKLLYLEKAKAGLDKSDDPISTYNKTKLRFTNILKETSKTGLSILGSIAKGTWEHILQPKLEQRYTKIRYGAKVKYQKTYEKNLNKYQDSLNEAIQSGDLRAERRYRKLIEKPNLFYRFLKAISPKDFQSDFEAILQDKISKKYQPAVFDEEVKVAITKGIPGILTKIAESLGAKDSHWSYELNRHVDRDLAIKADTHQIDKKLKKLESEQTKNRSFFEKNLYGKTRVLEKTLAETKEQKKLAESFRGKSQEGVFDKYIKIFNENKIKDVNDILDIVYKRKEKELLKSLKENKPQDENVKKSDTDTLLFSNISAHTDNINNNVYKILSIMSKNDLNKSSNIYKPSVVKVSKKIDSLKPKTFSITDKAKEIINKNKEEKIESNEKKVSRNILSTLKNILNINKNTHKEIVEQNKWVRTHWLIDKTIGFFKSSFEILKNIGTAFLSAIGGLSGLEYAKNKLKRNTKLKTLNKETSLDKIDKNKNIFNTNKKLDINNTKQNIFSQDLDNSAKQVSNIDKNKSALSKATKGVTKGISKAVAFVPGIGWTIAGGLALADGISSAFNDQSILERGGDPTSIYERIKQFAGGVASGATLGIIDPNSFVQGSEKLINFISGNGWNNNQELNNPNVKLIDTFKEKNIDGTNLNNKEDSYYIAQHLKELLSETKESNKILSNISKGTNETVSAIKDHSPQNNNYSTSNLEKNSTHVINNTSLYYPNVSNNFQSAATANTIDRRNVISDAAINASKN